MKLTADYKLRSASEYWNFGYGTKQIAKVLGVRESTIYNSLDAIKSYPAKRRDGRLAK